MPNSSLTQVTRADRAVNDDTWITALLRRAQTGVLGTAVMIDDVPQPFLSTLLFALDDSKHAIYLHGAKKGRRWENIHENERVCFTVSEIGRWLPADTALNFSVEYASVVVFGKIYLVEDPVEAEHGLQITLDKYFPDHKPGRDYRPITPQEIQATAVYRVDIDEWSGKKKQVPG